MHFQLIFSKTRILAIFSVHLTLIIVTLMELEACSIILLVKNWMKRLPTGKAKVNWYCLIKLNLQVFSIFLVWMILGTFTFQTNVKIMETVRSMYQSTVVTKAERHWTHILLKILGILNGQHRTIWLYCFLKLNQVIWIQKGVGISGATLVFHMPLN
jgi:hypothetical protein